MTKEEAIATNLLLAKTKAAQARAAESDAVKFGRLASENPRTEWDASNAASQAAEAATCAARATRAAAIAARATTATSAARAHRAAAAAALYAQRAAYLAAAIYLDGVKR